MLLDLLAGLALLLGGMRVLAGALQRALGGAAGEFLARLDGRPWLAAVGGAAVTALLQSSSVTTLVIAGLADARVLSPTAAAGAIMGANVGTTLTAYLTALDPLRAAPWLVAAGAAALLLSALPPLRRRLPVAAGAAAPAVAALGLGVAMAGLRGIEAAVQPLAAGEAWASRLQSVEHRPLTGLVAGVAITTVMDSSSAAIAVLQRLVQAGMLSLAGAIPVLLGDNIGTTTATVVAAAALGFRGRQSACVHLLFNLAGVALWWPLRGVLVTVAQSAATPAAGLARAHLFFNLTAAVLQLPLTRLHLAATARLFPGGGRPRA